MGEELQAKEMHIKWHNKHKNDTLDDHCKQLLHGYTQAMQEIREKEGADEELLTMQQKLEQDPEDCQLMYDIAQHCFEKEHYEEAIDYCIDILAIDRNWNHSAPHKLLLEIFNKLGTNNELVKQGRKKLTRVLF